MVLESFERPLGKQDVLLFEVDDDRSRITKKAGSVLLLLEAAASRGQAALSGTSASIKS